MSYNNTSNRPKMTDSLYDAVKAVSDSQPQNFFNAVVEDQGVEDAMIDIIENVIRIGKWDEIMLKYKERTAIAAALVKVRMRIIDEYDFTRDGEEAKVPRLKFKGVQVKAKKKSSVITEENAGDTAMGQAMLDAAAELPPVETAEAPAEVKAPKPAAKKAAAKKSAPKKAPAKTKAPKEDEVEVA